MKLYAVEGIEGLSLRLCEAEVVRETAAYYFVKRRSDGFSWSGRVPRSEAAITPQAAWERYIDRQQEAMNALIAQEIAVRKKLTAGQEALAALPEEDA